jgi:cellulose synthase/poly-beta-1,6-N-acetylglucosamine synthase-like glycosyltransferase
MIALAVLIVASPLVVGFYAYVIYPAVLWIITRFRNTVRHSNPTWNWPSVTVTVPVYNAASTIRRTLEQILALDYPLDRLQILVLSDASTDGTDDIAGEMSGRGVEVLRAPERRGKTAAENAAVSVARGEIIVNVDATVRVPPPSLKRLVAAFIDPTVGVASGRDISVDASALEHGPTGDASSLVATRAEAGYVGYEMWVRDLETRAGSIVGASGCFFAIRREIHKDPLPPELSWDFASALVARKLGYRAVSVPDAVCVVPRTAQLRTEVTRKSRTMARGLSTLFHFRELMNPLSYGGFALMLISHKLLRWLPYLLAPFALIALGFVAIQSRGAALGLLVVVIAASVCSFWTLADRRANAWRPVALAGFVVAACAAGSLAWYAALRGTRMVIWNPTPRANASTA